MKIVLFWRQRCLLFATPFALSILVSAQVTDSNTVRRVEFREPGFGVYLIEQPQNTNTGGGVRLTIAAAPSWTRATIEGTTNTVEWSKRIVLQLDPGLSIDSVLAEHKLALSRTISSNLFIIEAKDNFAATDAAEAISQRSGVIVCHPVMRRPFKRHNAYAPAPNDPRFGQQWFLENRTSAHARGGPDLNVRAAWPGTRGENVVVAVADDGFQLDHPELKQRGLAGLHFNFYKGTASGAPASSDADHATAVAGLIAAEANNDEGGAGVAPQARLASWVIFGTSFFGADSIANDEQLMDMFQYASNRVSVQNHSWGSATTAQSPIDTLSETGIGNAVSRGRGGKGMVMVRAAGNAREDLTDANDDGYASDPRVIAVAAIRKDGRATTYSSPGACLLVAAPSGDAVDTDGDGLPDAEDPDAPDVLTTDRTGTAGYNTEAGADGDYAGFNGTSASSPQIAGVAALILSANSNLTYRDVQKILIHSARHFDLADPGVHINGAGFRVSHNVGFGVPDAGFAVQLASTWPSQPAVRRISVTNTVRQSIPDDSLRLVCAGPGLDPSLTSIRCLPTLGLHPDDGTPVLPIVFVGQANEELTQDLHGKAALIERGTSLFSDKIARAARAGAVCAVIFNNIGTNQIQTLGGTTFVPIPAVSIGRNAGTALRDFIASHPQTTAQLQLTPATYRIKIPDTLICEHVGVRLKTTHTSRSDVRVTLVSPMGMRSVLQSINGDDSRGPRDWTYWSTQHFFESSAGEWRVEVSDERSTTVRSGRTTVAAIGDVIYVQLLIDGMPITDTDADGLDDAWERKWFRTMSYGPKDDPDQDGFNNAREQAMGTDPSVPNDLFRIDTSELQPGFQRLSWSAREGESYFFQSNTDLGSAFTTERTVTGDFPVTEVVVPVSPGESGFFRVLKTEQR